MSDDQEPRIDHDWIEQPMTRAEAYSVASKLRRMIGTVGQGVAALARGDPGSARMADYHLRVVDEELDGLLIYLLNGDRPETDV